MPREGWLRLAGARMRVAWFLKMSVTMLIMTGFFVVYFWLLNHARSPMTTVPRIFIDRMIGFVPEAWPLYISLWVYVPLAPALLLDRREMKLYALSTLVLSALGFAVFIYYPTTISTSAIDWSKHPSISFLKSVDASGNAFPSMHVAFAVFSAYWFARYLPRMGAPLVVRAANWIWCAGIVYSTVAIRQHVALDAVAGAVLGYAVARLQQRVLDRINPAGVEPSLPCKSPPPST